MGACVDWRAAFRQRHTHTGPSVVAIVKKKPGQPGAWIELYTVPEADVALFFYAIQEGPRYTIGKCRHALHKTHGLMLPHYVFQPVILLPSVFYRTATTSQLCPELRWPRAYTRPVLPLRTGTALLHRHWADDTLAAGIWTHQAESMRGRGRVCVNMSAVVYDTFANIEIDFICVIRHDGTDRWG